AHKIGSDDVCNIPFLKYVAETDLPIILSTGMSTLKEVRDAVDIILGCGNDQLILLHCVTNYPTYPESVNLKAIETLRNEFGLPVGYSDHTIGTHIPIAAAAMGACVIEKHFTLDKNAEGPDHMLSADPLEMKHIVEGIRTIEKARGDGVKRPAKSEMITRKNNRKSIVAVTDIPKGTVITKDMIDIKRPGYGVPPKFIELIVGRTAVKDIEAEDVITWELVN
ncbi:MAG: N-acetylneuraminate synthase family protein, partial [Candidatus Aenigmarchaeota archaeon]|nr:N-acetylneuraminate synthase family protein [Candidatus Aenigmarchaeota archaeon]